jgi:hypothetical protein
MLKIQLHDSRVAYIGVHSMYVILKVTGNESLSMQIAEVFFSILYTAISLGKHCRCKLRSRNSFQ